MVKFEDFIHAIASSMARVQRRIVKEQSLTTLLEDFDYEDRGEDDLPKLYPKEMDLHLKSHDAHVVEQDLIDTGSTMAFDEMEFEFETDVNIVEIPEKEREHEDEYFYIETSGKKSSEERTHISIKFKMKAVPEPQGMRVLREFFNNQFRDDIKGARKHERRSRV